MNLNEIKLILDRPIADDYKEHLIINSLAKDESVISLVLQMISEEREVKERLIIESNMELSRALVALDDKGLGTDKAVISLHYVIGEIKNHYRKWADRINCCFAFDDLP